MTAAPAHCQLQRRCFTAGGAGGTGSGSGAVGWLGIRNPRHVRALREIDLDFGFVPRLLVVLRQAFTDVHGRHADNRVLIGIVVRIAAEDLCA